MISIVTWVNKPEQYEQMRKSVRFTAEFIEVGQECKSMAEAYNKGTNEANGEWIIYCHQDVIFHDSNLDRTFDIISLTMPEAGIVGVVGSVGKSMGPWWEAPQDTWAGKLIQGEKLQVMRDYSGPAENLDGMFLATNKRFVFPEELPGIHFVDMWMCREAEKQGYTNIIISSMIQHLSQGTMDAQYYENLRTYQKKWGLA